MFKLRKHNYLTNSRNSVGQKFLKHCWRGAKAEKELLPQLIKFDDSIKNTIGLRLQDKLTKEQAKYVAACRSTHTDLSLNF